MLCLVGLLWTAGESSRWSVTRRWYLWDGGFLAIGRSEGVVPRHAHHAIQIVIAVEGTVGIRGQRGDWRMGNGVVVRPDVVHAYNGNGAVGAMLFVDPESLSGCDRRRAKGSRSCPRRGFCPVLASCAGSLNSALAAAAARDRVARHRGRERDANSES